MDHAPTTEQLDAYRTFWAGKVSPLQGWLEEHAAHVTAHLLTQQAAWGVRGPMLEIGVFGGKYFAIMMKAAEAAGDLVVGVDPFMWIGRDAVDATLRGLGLGTPFRLMTAFSNTLTARNLIDALGGEPRFISVDGSHDKPDVVWDLRLCEEILAGDGLVSVDDFLNPLTLGVNEGCHAFFAQPRNLQPVFLSNNKLYLTRPAHADRYQQACEAFLMAETKLRTSQIFQQQAAADRSHVEQTLWGVKVLLAAH